MIKKLIIHVAICATILLIHESYCKSEKINWCNKNKWCEYAAGPHIKCNNTGNFGLECPKEVNMININKEIRMEILHLHNKYRNLIASGKLSNYEPAKRMAQMCYCHNLARMAELNVKTCVYHYDYCRSTEKFHYSGQNIYRWFNKSDPKNITNIILSSINLWFEEYKLTDMSIIQQYRSVKEKISSFTTLVKETNRCVGCAAIKMFKDGMYEILFVCNYAITNIVDIPVYKKGKPGSKCKSGRSKKYPALCSNKEQYSIFTEERFFDDDD